MDYLTEKNGTICPIEIKSGAAGRLKSLHLLLKIFTHIPYGYVCSASPFGELPGQRLKFVPLYAAGRVFGKDLP